MKPEEENALYDVGKLEPRWLNSATLLASQDVYLDLAARGLLVQDGDHVALTDAGRAVMRDVTLWVMEVVYPGEAPMALKDAQELLDDIQWGSIGETLDLLRDGDFDDQQELFTIRARRITLYELATLPEWQS